MNLTLRERHNEDLPVLWHWMHAQPDPEWKRWDAPYFHSAAAPKSTSLEAFTEQAQAALPTAHQRIIALDGQCIGQATR
ncbi:hypothetical protein GCM10008955_03630 [Deinococcus malanensis]|uniref:N-acetyltransferase n=1 Tax=Deinococcus malanensis TaxID=1706855 RepID=A0ABQ2EIH4_9DEIO|nr:hypothetical protein [Deinococcus malanensis]GGK13535.1 hypothetical protein GCM10008955_03630 [Deinococcus malanensis]